MKQAPPSDIRGFPLLAAASLVLFLVAAPAHAQGFGGGGGGQAADTTGQGGAPNLAQLIASSADDSDFRVALRRFQQDRAVIGRRYDVPLSPVLIERQRTFLNGWMARLDAFDPAGLNAAGQTEYTELRTEIEEGLAELVEQEARAQAMAPLVPFARSIQLLQERRRDRFDVESFESAQTIEDARKEVLRLTALLDEEGGAASFTGVTAEVAADAASHLGSLQSVLNNWYNYYYGFDPLFTWWVQTPYREFTEALAVYRAAIERAWSIQN